MNTKAFKPLPVIESDNIRTILVCRPNIWPKCNPNIKPIRKYVAVRNRIRVSKLDPTTKRDDLHEEFSCFGPIALITKIKTIRTNDADHKKERYSYITFFLEEDAKLALKSATNFLKERSIFVEQAMQDPIKVNYRVIPMKRVYSMQTMLAVHEKYKKLFLEQDVGRNTKVCYAFIHRIDLKMPKNMKRSTILDPDSNDESSSTSLDDVESHSIGESNSFLEEQVLESYRIQESNPWLEIQILQLIPVVPENYVFIIENGWEFNPKNFCGLNNAEFNNFIYPNFKYIKNDQTYFQDPVYLNYQEPEFRGLHDAEFNNFVYSKPICIQGDQTYLENPDYLNYPESESYVLNDNNFVYPTPVYIEGDQTYFEDPDYLNYRKSESCVQNDNNFVNPTPIYIESDQTYLEDPDHLNYPESKCRDPNDAEFNNLVYPKPIYIESDQTYLEDPDYLNYQESEYRDLNDVDVNNFDYPKPVYIESDQTYLEDSNYLNYQESKYRDLNDAEFNNLVYPKPIYIESDQTYLKDPDYLNYQESEYRDPNIAEFNNFVYPKPVYIESDQTYLEDSDYLNYQESECCDPNHAEFKNLVYPKPVYIESDQMYLEDSDYLNYQESECCDPNHAEFKNLVYPKPIYIESDQTYLEDSDYLNYQESEYPLTTSYYYGKSEIIHDSILQDTLVPVHRNDDYYDLNNEYCIPEENINYDPYYVDSSMYQDALVPVINLNAFETEYNQIYEFCPTVIATFHEYGTSNQLNVENQYADLPDSNYIQVHSSQLHEYVTNYQNYDDVPHLIEQAAISPACEMHEYETNYQYYDDAQIYDFAEHDYIDMHMMPIVQENDGTSEVPYLIEQPMIPLACEMHEYEADYQYYDDAHIISDFANYDGIEMSTIQENYVTSEVPHNIVEQQMVSPECEMREYETDGEAEIIDLTEYGHVEMPMIPENDSTSEVLRINPYQYYSDSCDELLKQIDVLKDQFRKSREVNKLNELQSQCNVYDTKVPHIVEQQTISPKSEMHADGETEIIDLTEYGQVEMPMIPENDSTSEVPRINPYQHSSETCNELLKQIDLLKDLFCKSREVDEHDELQSQCNVLQITETVIEPSTSINEEIKQDVGKSEIELKILDKTQDKCAIIDESSKCGFYVSVRDVATQFPEHGENLINTFAPEVVEASLQKMETQIINTPENLNKESTPRLTFADVTKRGAKR